MARILKVPFTRAFPALTELQQRSDSGLPVLSLCTSGLQPQVQREHDRAALAEDREGSRKSVQIPIAPKTADGRKPFHTKVCRAPICRNARRPPRRGVAPAPCRAASRRAARIRRGSPLERVTTSISSARSLVARPKSSTFALPSGVTVTFAGFRSRWTIRRW